MYGGIELYVKSGPRRLMWGVSRSAQPALAMSQRQAVGYFCSQPQIESIVDGASSRSNVRQTKQLFGERTMPTPQAQQAMARG